ncbi:MAG TPA: PilZ domain-containing protein [Candidatus Saccharimonadales bacterium]|jgi:hypothetical protein|nr:PilZ domain-containing protein [Candidatus Saccharimonadales bacterium]
MDRTLMMSSDAAETKKWIERAVRYALHLPLRYRVEGEEKWMPGETLNLSESGVLFSSDQMLEVATKVEITFQTMGSPMLQTSTRLAEVVRRVLSNWPETRPVFGARFRN